MIYRLVYKDAYDELWVQYGEDNVHHCPHYLPNAHASPENTTVHPTISTAMIAIERSIKSDNSIVPILQFAQNRYSSWSNVVADETVLTHIDGMIAC